MTDSALPRSHLVMRLARPRVAARIASHVGAAVWAAALVTCLGATLRLYHLGARSLWLDETITASAARVSSLAGIADEVRARPDQMPLIDVVTWLLRGVEGSDWMIRLPAALAGIALVPAMYALGSSLARPRVGLLAALLVAISPFAVWYSQEARAYAPLMLLTALQMLCAYQAVVTGRPHRWVVLALVSVLNLYTHYAAVLVTAAAYTFVGVTLLGHVSGDWRHRRGHGLRRSLRQVLLALASGALVGIAYLPWVAALGGFVHHEEAAGSTSSAGPSQAAALLAALDFQGPILACLLVGVAVSVVGAVRGAPSGRLLLFWIAVPLVALWYRMGPATLTLLPRYLSFLFPAGMLLTAIGLDALVCRVAGLIQGRHTPRRASVTLFAVGIIALCGSLAPTLVRSYGLPKDDYRDVAARVSPAGSRGAVILTLGPCAPYLASGLSYYLWRDGARGLAVQGNLVDDRTVALLRHPGAGVWAAISTNCWLIDTLHGVPLTGLQVLRFPGITLVRERNHSGSPHRQAVALLRWAGRFQHDLSPSLTLLRLLSSGVRNTTNILPPLRAGGPAMGSNHWSLSAGATLEQRGGAFLLAPAGPMVNVTATVPALSGQQFVLFFRYRNAALQGDQRVYVTPLDRANRWLGIDPSGAGYLCSPTRQWARGVFAFAAPPGTAALQLWFRATGRGRAEYADLRLYRVRPPG